MNNEHEDNTEQLIARLDLDHILSKLTPEDRDILQLWLNGGYTMEDIAKIIKSRYENHDNLTRKELGLKIKDIIARVRTRIGLKS